MNELERLQQEMETAQIEFNKARLYADRLNEEKQEIEKMSNLEFLQQYNVSNKNDLINEYNQKIKQAIDNQIALKNEFDNKNSLYEAEKNRQDSLNILQAKQQQKVMEQEAYEKLSAHKANLQKQAKELDYKIRLNNNKRESVLLEMEIIDLESTELYKNSDPRAYYKDLNNIYNTYTDAINNLKEKLNSINNDIAKIDDSFNRYNERLQQEYNKKEIPPIMPTKKESSTNATTKPDVNSNTSQSNITDVYQLVNELIKLNPDAEISIADPKFAPQDSIYSSIPIDRLVLPEGFYHNDKNGLTNKHNTESGLYVNAEVKNINDISKTDKNKLIQKEILADSNKVEALRNIPVQDEYNFDSEEEKPSKIKKWFRGKSGKTLKLIGGITAAGLALYTIFQSSSIAAIFNSIKTIVSNAIAGSAGIKTLK